MASKLAKNTKKKYLLVVDEWFNNGFSQCEAYKKYFPNVVKNATASANFARIQNHPEIKPYILEKYEKARRIVDATHEGILNEIKNWIESDITETICLTPSEIKKLPIEIRRLITQFKHTTRNHYNNKGDLVETVETIQLKFVSKERALDMLNKHLGFYEADNIQKAPEINIFAKSEKHTTIIQDILNGK